MIVVDASIVVTALIDSTATGMAARRLLERSDVAAPVLLDVEVCAALRRLWSQGKLSDADFRAALADFAQFRFERYPVTAMLGRMFELRANVSAYDATYVTLAEALGCELVTGDLRLLRLSGPRCPIVPLQVP